jgi:hypothetical protein
MAHSALKTHEIVDAAVSGRFDIPEFQRGFVWSPEKVKNLLDSLCRDYPLGSILCWRSGDYTSARMVPAAEANRLWIVDGQQRATAMCLILGKKPYWFPSPEPWNTLYRKCDVRVNLLPEGDEVELSLPNPVIAKSAHWVPVRELLVLSERDKPVKAQELLERLGRAPGDVVGLVGVMGIIGSLQAALRREVVVIEIDHDPVDVAEIFSRLNGAGTRVNDGDIALALIAVRQEGWVREQLLPYLDDLKQRGFEFDPSYIIRSMVAVRRGSARLQDVPREFWDKDDRFDDGWRRTKSAISHVLRVLRELGVLSAEILPSRNALIPMYALDDVHLHGDANGLRRVFLWLLRATRDGRYSGAATTAMSQDLTAIHRAPDAEAALQALQARLESPLTFTPADMLRRYDEDAFLRLMLYLVAFHRGAEDWQTGQRLGFDRSDNSLNDGFRPEWHHFVPRGLLGRRAPEPPSNELTNSIANIVVLGEGDNRRFSYNEPHKYLAKYRIPDERVHQQVFPARELWRPERFEAMVEERSKLLERLTVA